MDDPTLCVPNLQYAFRRSRLSTSTKFACNGELQATDDRRKESSRHRRRTEELKSAEPDLGQSCETVTLTIARARDPEPSESPTGHELPLAHILRPQQRARSCRGDSGGVFVGLNPLRSGAVKERCVLARASPLEEGRAGACACCGMTRALRR